MNYYHPQTQERIVTTNPADWMGQTDIDPPAYDPQAQGCFWRGTAWELVEPLPPAMPVPTIVTMRQARLALLAAGLLAGVNSTVAAMPGTEGDAARIEWEFAATVDRTSPLVQALEVTLGLTEAQLDALFVAGAAL
jgi:hypothetical protein